jgi:hypothetical protein
MFRRSELAREPSIDELAREPTIDELARELNHFNILKAHRQINKKGWKVYMTYYLQPFFTTIIMKYFCKLSRDVENRNWKFGLHAFASL